MNGHIIHSLKKNTEMNFEHLSSKEKKVSTGNPKTDQNITLVTEMSN